MSRNNRVFLAGKIVEAFPAGRVQTEEFNRLIIDVERKSKVIDRLPVLVPESVLHTPQQYVGECVTIEGEYRSRNYHADGKSHLILYVFAKKISFVEVDMPEVNNYIYLSGFLCKPPVHRRTPRGRKITEFLMAVNRESGRTDYIPCIAWEECAPAVSALHVEDQKEIAVAGRIQSRIYTKNTESDLVEYTTYEVSINKLAL